MAPGTTVHDRRLPASMALLVMVTSTFVVASISVLAASLRDDLELETQAIGYLVAGVMAVAAVASNWAGRGVDAWPMSRSLGAVAAAAAGSAACIALATSPVLLVPGAGLAGVAVALGNPVSNALLSRGPGAPRGYGASVGLKQTGPALGLAVAGVLLPLVAGAWGWRVAMLAVVPACTVLVGRAAARRSSVAATPAVPAVGDAPAVDLAWLSRYGALMGVGAGTFTAYLPLFAVDHVGAGQALAGVTATAFGAAGVVVRIASAHVLRAAPDLRRALAAMAALALVSVVVVILAVNAAMLVVAAVLAGASVNAWNAVGALAILRGSDPTTTGRASGLATRGWFAGFATGPLVAGLLVGATDGYRVAWTVSAVLFALAIVVAHPQGSRIVRRPLEKEAT